MEKNEEIADDAVLRLHRQQRRWPRARSGTNLPAARTRNFGLHRLKQHNTADQTWYSINRVILMHSSREMEDGTAVLQFCTISRLSAFQTVVTITGTGRLHPSGCRGSAIAVLQTVTLGHWQRPFPWLAAAARDRGADRGTRRSGCCPCPAPDAPAVAAGAGAGSQALKWQRRRASGAHLPCLGA